MSVLLRVSEPQRIDALGPQGKEHRKKTAGTLEAETPKPTEGLSGC
ncbi:MAG: hypothetical protein MK364_16655 [Pirellulales bacterium]|nr:hypothetical protein [Pirellulales bacterium]